MNPLPVVMRQARSAVSPQMGQTTMWSDDALQHLTPRSRAFRAPPSESAWQCALISALNDHMLGATPEPARCRTGVVRLHCVNIS